MAPATARGDKATTGWRSVAVLVGVAGDGDFEVGWPGVLTVRNAPLNRGFLVEPADGAPQPLPYPDDDGPEPEKTIIFAEAAGVAPLTEEDLSPTTMQMQEWAAANPQADMFAQAAAFGGPVVQPISMVSSLHSNVIPPRQGLGVDDLNVGSDENGGAQVTAGKYLNRRTYLELKQGEDETKSGVAINLDIGKGVKLRGEATADGNTSTGVFFEKEY